MPDPLRKMEPIYRKDYHQNNKLGLFEQQQFDPYGADWTGNNFCYKPLTPTGPGTSTVRRTIHVWQEQCSEHQWDIQLSCLTCAWPTRKFESQIGPLWARANDSKQSMILKYFYSSGVCRKESQIKCPVGVQGL